MFMHLSHYLVRKPQCGEVGIDLDSSSLVRLLLVNLLAIADSSLDVVQGDGVEHLEQAGEARDGFGDVEVVRAEGGDEGLQAGEVGAIFGFNDLAEEDYEGDEGGEEDRPAVIISLLLGMERAGEGPTNAYT